MIEMLFSKGIDPNATNFYGDSPLEAATENDHTEVAGFLKSHGALRFAVRRSSTKQRHTP